MSGYLFSEVDVRRNKNKIILLEQEIKNIELGSTNINLTSDDVGLGNVDNTSDINKPISTLVQAELNSINLYTNSNPMPSDVGGQEAGNTFAAVPILTVLNNLLYPYQYPTFSSFVLTGLTLTRYEVGVSISGEQRFDWVTTDNTNINSNSIQISGDNITTLTGLANDTFEVVTFNTMLTRTTAGTKSWTIQGINSKSQTFSRSKSIRWDFIQYYGSSTNTSLTEAQIKSLQYNRLTPNNVTGTYLFPSTGYKYFVFADDNSYTKPSSFQDIDTGFAIGIHSGYSNTQNGYSYDLVNVTSSTGISKNYRVYRTSNQLSAAINIQIN